MKKIIITFIISFAFINAYSQSFDPSRITFGGSLGMQFGDYTTVNVAPQVGYNFNKYINTGVGLAYTYYKDDYYYGLDKYKSTRSYFGINVYARFYPTDFLVMMVQPEGSRMWDTVKTDRTEEKYSENKFVPSVLVGGGLRFGPVTAMVKYDVVQDDNSPYGNNIFYSVGYTFGF